MAKKSVLILFGNNLISYNIAAAICRNGYQVISCVPKDKVRLFNNSSKFKTIYYSKYNLKSQEYLNDLLLLLKKYIRDTKILTFLSNDEAINFWISNQNVLSDYCSILTRDIDRFYIKSKFYKELEKISVLYPKTFLLDNIKPDDFPIILKSSAKEYKDKGLEKDGFVSKFGRKIKVIENAEALKEIFGIREEQLIIQKKIDFEIGDELSWCGYRSKSGKIYSYSVLHADKFPDRYGRISSARIVDDSEIKRIGDNIVSKLNYIGVADIQFIYSRKENTYRVIEMNPRFWCSHELLLMNNINLIKQCVDDYYNYVNHNTDNILEIKDIKSLKVWYSILFNIGKIKANRIKNTELYQIESDNILTRIKVNFYMFFKYLYYYKKK